MRYILKVFIGWAVVYLLMTSFIFADSLTGKIVDVFGDKITIEMKSDSSFAQGEKIEVSYMAGAMEMLIGSYEIVGVQKNVLIAKEISLVMSPSKDMKVTVVKAQGFVLDQPDPGAMEPPSRDPRFNNVSPENYEIKHNDQKVPDADKEVSNVKIQGEVIEVMGTDVRVKLTSSGDVKVGLAVDLTYVTSRGMELPVGTWKVTSVNNREVVAASFDKDVKPRIGMKALVYKGHEKRSVKKDLPASASVTVDEDGFPDKKRMFEHRSSSNDGNPPYSERSSFEPITIPPPIKEKKHPFDQAALDLYNASNYDASVRNSKNAKSNSSLSLQQKIGLGVEQAGKTRRYWLGVEIADAKDPLTQKRDDFLMGVVVVAVMPNSAAQRGGIEKGDIIKRVNGTGVNNKDHFVSLINRSNGKVKLGIQRNNKKIKKTIKLDKMK